MAYSDSCLINFESVSYFENLQVYRIGFNYSKAEVILLNLCQQGNSPRICLPGRSGEATKVLSVLDAINDRCGRGTLRVASVLTTPDWGHTTPVDEPELHDSARSDLARSLPLRGLANAYPQDRVGKVRNSRKSGV